jgi:thiol-disulfide isomerase/thioredoxin
MTFLQNNRRSFSVSLCPYPRGRLNHLTKIKIMEKFTHEYCDYIESILPTMEQYHKSCGELYKDFEGINFRNFNFDPSLRDRLHKIEKEVYIIRCGHKPYRRREWPNMDFDDNGNDIVGGKK